MKESRLFQIVYYLLDKGFATADELAEKCEVSVRTIYRDLDSLSAAGIPVYSETGRNGGIKLHEEFKLDKALFSEKEKQELLSSLKSLSALSGVGENDAVMKLSALFHVHSEDWLEVDFSRWGNKGSDNEKFMILKNAVLNHQKVKINYISTLNEKKERIIHPLKLVYKSKDWYLKCYCELKNDFRFMKLNRIIEITALNESFLPKSYPKEESVRLSYPKITLKFSKEAAYRVFDEFDAREIETLEDQSMIVTAQMPIDDWLIGYLLFFGTLVEVIEPAYLQNLLLAHIAEIYKKI